jgi:1-acyl-sn-glycerol-3-phosphate acyltransferase
VSEGVSETGARGPVRLPAPGLLVVARSLLFTVWLYGAMGVCGLLGLPALFGPRRALWAVVRAWVAIVEWGLRWIVGCRVEVRGREHAPKGGALVAGKHFAMLDTITPLRELPDPAYVLKRELMKLPFWGWYTGKLDMIPIDRAGGSATVRAMMAAARSRAQAGRQVLIFPEGTRQAPGDPPDYKPGVAGLYRELGVPVTPMATNSGLCWPAHGVIRRPGVVVYEFLPAIPPGLKRAAFMAELERVLEAASDRLIAEELARRGSGG